MNIPSRGSWGNNHEQFGFDYLDAFEKFHGLSNEEAVDLFKGNALYFQELLYYMLQRPFDFYYECYESYILSFSAKEDSDGASAFLDAVFDFLQAEWLEIDQKKTIKMIEAARYVSERQNFFEADIEIYGDFKERFRERINKSKNLHSSY